ncbi:MAG: glyceraldehyde dehydrogenase subunit alpha, partial [Dehalococcoidia bacterium]
MTTAETAQEVPKLVGARVKRREDPRLITGNATYVDDLQLVRMLYLTVVRSEMAHARITTIDVSRATSMPGVVAVLTAKDVAQFVPTLPTVPATPDMKTPPHPLLQNDKARYVGDPIAVVIAEDRYQAADAADAVEVTYDELPAVVDLEKAIEPGAAAIHDEVEQNTAYFWTLQSGDIEQAFKDAAVVVKQKMASQRLMGTPLETRAVVAEYRPGQEELTLWSSTQIPHLLKVNLAVLLGMPENHVRVIAPEVGGGFGVKLDVYAEELLCAIAARQLGRPVKWVETRSENFQATVQGRGQLAEYEVAADADGRITGLRARILADMGGYLSLFTAAVPTFSGLMLPGPYDITNLDAQILGVYTNKTPTGAYRGAGRPEATYYIERMMDLLAAELTIDPVEVRRRNFIAKEKFPYTTATGLVYDSGDYDITTNKLVEMLDYDELRREQARKREQGIQMGIGISTWVEICGMGPSAAFPAGGWEYGAVRIERTGKVIVSTGASPHGQGQETSFAQIVADEFSVPIEDITVLHGDTAMVPNGVGTFGSRATVVGGAAIIRAATQVKEKMKRFAAHAMDASEDDLEFANGRIGVRGSPDRAVAFAEVAAAAYNAVSLPPDTEPGLEASSFFEPPNFTYPFGTHAAVVEVDKETGQVKLTRYIAVDDCGTVINPLLVEGQVHGGLAQGIAQALTEEVVHDENGQVLSGTLMDYALPTADLFPRFETANTVTTTPVNPLGAKGIGEAGTIASSPTIVSAVMDALAPFGVRHIDM